MTEPIPDTYELQRVDQLKAIADELRQRILFLLADEPLTVTQLGDRLGVAPAKAHYHVRELERVGLLHLVETRERGGILEKYYRSIARDVEVPRSLLRALPREENVAMAAQFATSIQDGFLHALSQAADGDDHGGRAALSRLHLWLTDDEFREVLEAIDEALQPYRRPRGVEGERQRTFAQIMYDTQLAATSSRNGGTRDRPHVERTIAAGGFTYSRDDLERMRQRNELLDLTALGLVRFKDDVPAELVDRVVTRFRHKGVLQASPSVRAVLETKRGKE